MGATSLDSIGTDLQFKPGGNPYSDLSTGGLAGLGTAYGNSYNSALSANQQNYNNVMSGYKSLAGQVGNILGQGGTPWGVAQPAYQAIQDTLASAKGGAMQNSINKGLGGSTAAVAAQRGANLDAMKAEGSLGAQLAQTYAGYTSGIGQGMLGAMQSTQIPFPNGQEYSNLYQQYGQQQASAQNMALLAQQQASQQQLAMRALSLSAAGRSPGGGAAPTPQMPRGGTFGSGGGGFPSGGGFNPSASGTGAAPIGAGQASLVGNGSGNWGNGGYGILNLNPGPVGGEGLPGMGGEEAAGGYGGSIGMGGGFFGGGGDF